MLVSYQTYFRPEQNREKEKYDMIYMIICIITKLHKIT